MQWTPEQLEIIRKIKKLKDVPENERRYKCHSCHVIFDANHCHAITNPACPECGTTDVQQMCPLDHIKCAHEIFSHAEMCPICGDPICPACGCHDVEVISRITGYLQDLSGWNEAKRQEFRDRIRYTV